MGWIVILAFIFLGLLVLLLPVIAIIDILRHDFKRESNKIIWVLVIFFLPLLGSILYFLIGERDKILPS